MSTNFHIGAANRSSAEPYLTGHPEINPHKHVQMETRSKRVINRKESASTALIQNSEYLSFSSGQTDNVFGTSTSLKIRIPTAGIHICHGQTLKLVVANADDESDTAISIVPPCHWISRIEILAQDRNVLVETIYGDSISNFMRKFMSDNELDAIENASGDADTAETLANDSSATYYLPFMSFMNTCEPFIAGFSGDLVYEIHFRTADDLIITGNNADLSMTSCDLILHTQELPPKKYREKLAESKNGIVDYPFLTQVPMSFSGTFGSASNYTFTLAALDGLCAFMYIMVRASKTDAGIYTFRPLDSFNLLDNTSHTITGLQQVDGVYNMAVQQPVDWALHSAVYKDGTYVWSHSASPPSALRDGGNYGFFAYTGKEILQITTKTESAASAQVDVLAFMHSMIRINRGRVSVMRS